MACGCEGAKCKLEPGDKRHGTRNGYTHGDCRCDGCREAKRERARAYYETNREAVLEHNKAYYEANREARREYRRAYREANLEDERERKKAYYEANREAVLERKKAYYEDNREAVLERQKAYYEANREALREYNKAYREANREARLERQKAYREANREALLEYFKAYYKANPDQYREKTARRRARRANATIGPNFTRQQVWDRDNGTCHICGKPADPDNWHMDHVVPLALEGAHSFDNCAPSHPLCNLRKGARLLEELDLEGGS